MWKCSYTVSTCYVRIYIIHLWTLRVSLFCDNLDFVVYPVYTVLPDWLTARLRVKQKRFHLFELTLHLWFTQEMPILFLQLFWSRSDCVQPELYLVSLTHLVDFLAISNWSLKLYLQRLCWFVIVWVSAAPGGLHIWARWWRRYPRWWRMTPTLWTRWARTRSWLVLWPKQDLRSQ